MEESPAKRGFLLRALVSAGQLLVPKSCPPETQPEHDLVELTEADVIGSGAKWDPATGQLRDEADLEKIKVRVRRLAPDPEE